MCFIMCAVLVFHVEFEKKNMSFVLFSGSALVLC